MVIRVRSSFGTSELESAGRFRDNPRMADDAPITLGYDRGTVVLAGGPSGFDFQALPGVLFDPRTSAHRAQGRYYRGIVEQLVRT